VTPARWAAAVALGLIVTALFWIDAIFIPLALLGPLVAGAVAAMRRLPWQWPVAAFVVAGLGAVVSDWVVNHEDVAFHLVLTVVMAILALGAWAVARTILARRPVPAP
jgi:hypothetical protein